jgi:hypothetical protein
MKSIAFVVGKILRVVELDTDVNEIKELGLLLREGGGHLNLAERFEAFFVESVSKTEITDYKLILLANAGFTDSRVVYLWLKGEKQLSGASFEMYREVEEIDLEAVEDFVEFFASHKHTDTLEYSREPSVG